MTAKNDASMPSTDSTVSGDKPRLALRRERVKSLRVGTGVRTGGNACPYSASGVGKGCQDSGVNPVGSSLACNAPC